MNPRAIQPETIAPPAAQYAHGMLVEGPKRLLHTSGVVPVRADGTVPSELSAQAVVVWSNLRAIVDEANMAMSDIVSTITYVVSDQDLSKVMAARDEALGGHLVASTLVVVSELAQPSWKVEVAVVAVA